jgi:hypothetical protein
MKQILLLLSFTILFTSCQQQNKNSEEISKEEILKEIELLQKLEDSIQVTKIDSAKIKELKNFFRIKTDEFSTTGLTWYQPKSAPNYSNRNALYCYFHTENNVASNLRFKLQYYSEDWLFFDKVQFSIDGKAYEYIPSKTETDSGDGGHIWEWFDESVYESDRELLNALANAKSAKMKLSGKYFDVRNITKEQIKAIKQTLDLYEAMGGTFTTSY